MGKFPWGNNHKTIENSQNSFPREGLFPIREKTLAVIKVYSYKIEQNLLFVYCKKSKARWHYQKTLSNFTQKKYLKYLKEKRPPKQTHRSIIQTSKSHVLGKIERSSDSESTLMANVIQRLEIYGLFADLVVVVVFCASNTRTHHPSMLCF